jgi:hypothetical protein
MNAARLSSRRLMRLVSFGAAVLEHDAHPDEWHVPQAPVLLLTIGNESFIIDFLSVPRLGPKPFAKTIRTHLARCFFFSFRGGAPSGSRNFGLI